MEVKRSEPAVNHPSQKAEWLKMNAAIPVPPSLLAIYGMLCGGIYMTLSNQDT
jgi:hypothetical protein